MQFCYKFKKIKVKVKSGMENLRRQGAATAATAGRIGSERRMFEHNVLSDQIDQSTMHPQPKWRLNQMVFLTTTNQLSRLEPLSQSTISRRTFTLFWFSIAFFGHEIDHVAGRCRPASDLVSSLRLHFEGYIRSFKGYIFHDPTSSRFLWKWLINHHASDLITFTLIDLSHCVSLLLSTLV